MDVRCRKHVLIGSSFLLFFFFAQVAHADSYSVTINTAGLVGTPSQYEVFVAFSDGAGSGDGNNSALLTNFDLGGGTVGPSGSVSSLGDASGALTSGISIGDSLTSYSGLVAGFTPGNTLSFDFSMSMNADAGGAQDEFFFFIWNTTTNQAVQTTDGVTQEFLKATVCPTCSDGLNIQSFNMPDAPATTAIASTAVPEPATLPLCAGGILGLGILAFGMRKRCLSN